VSVFKQGDRVRVTLKHPAFDAITLHDGQVATVESAWSAGASIRFDDGFGSDAFDDEMETVTDAVTDASDTNGGAA